MKKTSSKSSERSHKAIPQRTCIACHQVKTKQEMVRLVRTVDNNIEIDSSGKKPGRGAYICRNPECWEAGLKGNRLDHVLRVSLTEDNRKKLAEDRDILLQGVR